MKKLKMSATKGLTFEEGCNKYLEYCRQRNLREGTIVSPFNEFEQLDCIIKNIDCQEGKFKNLKDTLARLFRVKNGTNPYK